MRRAIFSSILAALGISLLPSLALPQDDSAAPDSRPRWFKGNLHTHSLWSDGNDYPEMIVDWYHRRRDYHFLALSDHNILSQGQKWMSVAEADKRARHDGFERYRKRFGDDWVETRKVDGDLQVRLKPLGEFRTLFEQPGRFLLIQGEEITDHFEKNPIHMNASNLVDLIPPQGGKSVVEVMTNDLAAVEEQSKRLGRPILGHLNHPNFGYAITAEELAMVIKERFFEVYNGHPGVNHRGDETHASVERMWDIINTLRIGEIKAPPVSGLATDDSHNYFGTSGSSPGRGWVMARARFLTPESIIRGIEIGDFYASSGVTLSDVRYSPKSRTLELEIEPKDGASYTTEFIGTLKDYDRTRTPVKDRDGKELPVTQRYSEDVGRVLAKVEGTKARYQLTGEELYVRAVVSSSQPPENPSFPDQRAQAWTQPVGWEKSISTPDLGRQAAKEKATREAAPVQVTVDTSEVPEVAPWADEAKRLVEKWHPIIADLLPSDGFIPPSRVKLIFKKEMKRIAGTSGATVTISADWVKRHPDDFGMVIHELTHIIQSYPRTREGWLVEGIADQVRFYHFEPQTKLTLRDPEKASYRDGYRTTAMFLAWVERKYDKAILRKLNEALRRSQYHPELFQDSTSKSLDDLWAEFVEDSK